MTLLLPKRNDDGSDNADTLSFVENFNKAITDICSKVDYKHFDPDTSPLKDGDAVDDAGKPIYEGKQGFYFMNLNREAKHGRIPVVAADGKALIKNLNDFPKRGDAIKVAVLLSYYQVGTNKGLSAKPTSVQLVARGVLANKEALSDFADSDHSSDFENSVQDSQIEGEEGEDASEDDVPF